MLEEKKWGLREFTQDIHERIWSLSVTKADKRNFSLVNFTFKSFCDRLLRRRKNYSSKLRAEWIFGALFSERTTFELSLSWKHLGANTNPSDDKGRFVSVPPELVRAQVQVGQSLPGLLRELAHAAPGVRGRRARLGGDGGLLVAPRGRALPALLCWRRALLGQLWGHSSI